MRVLLIAYDNDNSIAYFPLGLGYLASAIRNADYEVEIYQQDIYHYPPEHLTEYLNNTKGACHQLINIQTVKSLYAIINCIK